MQRAEEYIYTAMTRDIRVSVAPEYMLEESNEEKFTHAWSYTVQVANFGKETVQLLNRHWKITDANGKIEEVHGAGVLGQQPTLHQGQAFQYSSWCKLKTPSGMMVGAYEMQTQKGETFLVEIPAFSLDIPDTIFSVN
jgi:ApaG protein